MKDDKGLFIIGADGQLGKALQVRYPNAKTAGIKELDITDRDSLLTYDWSGITHVLNAAAYTNVDGAETPEGRLAAWKVNATAAAYLSETATSKNLTLIHISTDYVFDGSQSSHTEDEPFSPLSVYGASKAAGDIAVSLTPKHYILRTSWVIGQGKNFVRTMLELGQKGVNPAVVSDQFGRLTFTTELVRATDHLLAKEVAYGTYNVSNEGDATNWADITRSIYQIAGLTNTVTDITTTEYYKDKPEAAGRPLNSTLDLSKIQSTGFVPHDWHGDLAEYINKELE